MNRRFQVCPGLQVLSLAAASLVVVGVLNAAELKPVTLSAWDHYVESADAAMQDRLRPGATFLWADEAADRRRQLRAGEILVTEVGDHNPRKVASGLIHHWLGAAFIPDTKLDNVLGVVRDYAHYKDYYHPTVIDSRTIRRTRVASQSEGIADTDRFSTLLMNKALFLKVALDNEYECSYVPVGPGRSYSITTAVRVQEIEGYGQLDEHKLPLDQGSGYMWRLHGITRYQQADGGVYIEIEAMALSREIPAAMHWAVDPIVRRVSKSSLITSLRQTQAAVNGSSQIVSGQPLAVPALASGFAQSSRH
jgi:hypothetical protein